MKQPNQVDPNNYDDRDRLRALLLEDTESVEEADALIDTLTHLKRWQAPRPDIAATAKLIDVLQAELPRARDHRLHRIIQSLDAWWPLLLMRAQLRVVRSEIWAASALVMLLGTVVTLFSYMPASKGLAPIAIFAPLVAAVGVAFLYDTEVEQMLEIENSTPASSRIILLTRLTLVFGFDFILGLVGSVILAVVNAEVSLWPLVLSWLAPMTFLSATSFLLTILLGDALISSLFGMLIWGVHIWFQAFPGDDMLSSMLSLPGLSSPTFRPILLGCALLLMIVALWLAGREERIIAVSS